MHYYVYMKQGGQGCGYQVGCGEKFALVEGATSIEDAKQRVIHELLCPDEPEQNRRYHLQGGEQALDVIQIVAVESITDVDLQTAWQDRQHDLDTQKLAASQVAREAHDRAEYERLKAKFGQ